jgi:nicotinamidase-related amidase
MNQTALLIIDMQTGNFSEPNPIYKGNELLSKVKKLIDKARSTQALIVYVQNNGAKGDPDEYGTSGWEVHPAITPVQNDVTIQKNAPDAFHETSLQNELESRSIKKLVITGLQTEYCIDTTCRRAFSLGYEVTLVKDGHSTWDSPDLTAQQIIDHHNRVLSGFFASLKNETDIEFQN